MNLFWRRAIQSSEVAVVVGGRMGDHTRTARRESSLLSEQQMIPIDTAGCVGFSAQQSPGRLPLAADVIAVLANQLVKGEYLKILTWIQSLVREATERYERGLGGIIGSHGNALSLQIVDIANPIAGPHEDNQSQFAVRIAHADRFRAPAEDPGDTLGLQPRQRRIPSDVNVAGEVRLHLALVVRVEDIIESQTVPCEIALESVPNCDDFGVVRDSAQKKSGVVVHGLGRLEQR